MRHQLLVDPFILLLIGLFPSVRKNLLQHHVKSKNNVDTHLYVEHLKQRVAYLVLHHAAKTPGVDYGR